MHIVHVATGFLGGSEVIVRQLITMQRAADHRVTLIYGKFHNGFAAGTEQLTSDLEMIGWDADREISLAADLAAYRTLVAHLRQLKPDVVHMHNSKAGALGRLACWRLGIRNIYSPHGPPYLRHDIGNFRRFVYFAIEWGLSLFGDQLVTSSEGEMRAMRAMSGSKHLVHNGVDVAEIHRKAAGVPVKPHDGRIRIVISGRIWAQKNPELVARIAAQSPLEWEWYWIGDGPQRAVLDATGRVTILGWQEREAVLATLQTADIYLQASHWEGMSFALLEALALGKPSVVSNVPGNQDAVQNGINGYVCDNDGDYLAALSRLAADSILRRRLGEAASRRVTLSFGLDRAARRWSKLYRGLASSSAPFQDFLVTVVT